MITRLFDLTTSGDARAVLDCYALRLRGEAGFEDFASRWAASGPASGLAIKFIDRVKECDRYSAQAELVHGETVAHFGRQSTFFSVGPEDGVMRIYDAGSGLASEEATLVVCR